MPSGDGKHLFVVCTSPCSKGKVVIANISTWKGDKCDGTVRLTLGDHPFLDRDSYVAYNFSDIERTITIDAGVRLGRFVQREDFSEPQLSAVEQGLLASRYTPRKIKNI